MMIKIKEEEKPWWEKYRDPKKFKDTQDFVDGYNQCLDDMYTLMGTKQLKKGEYRNASLWGSNQINKLCEDWKLTKE